MPQYTKDTHWPGPLSRSRLAPPSPRPCHLAESPSPSARLACTAPPTPRLALAHPGLGLCPPEGCSTTRSRSALPREAPSSSHEVHLHRPRLSPHPFSVSHSPCSTPSSSRELCPRCPRSWRTKPAAPRALAAETPGGTELPQTTASPSRSGPAQQRPPQGRRRPPFPSAFRTRRGVAAAPRRGLNVARTGTPPPLASPTPPRFRRRPPRSYSPPLALLPKSGCRAPGSPPLMPPPHTGRETPGGQGTCGVAGIPSLEPGEPDAGLSLGPDTFDQRPVNMWSW